MELRVLRHRYSLKVVLKLMVIGRSLLPENPHHLNLFVGLDLEIPLRTVMVSKNNEGVLCLF